MLILTLRTDKPEAEIGLFDNNKPLTYHEWLAHRKLAETINLEIKNVLEAKKLSLSEIEGIVVYQGPGSFTGLRIGISVANALADSLQVPIVGIKENGNNDWTRRGIEKLLNKENDKIVIPFYGAEANITKPKK